MTITRIILVLMILLATISFSCSSESDGQNSPDEGSNVNGGSSLSGTFQSGQYKNDYFGFAVSIPDSWQITYDAFQGDLDMPANEFQYLPLLDCLEYPPGSGDSRIASLNIAVQKLPLSSDIHSGEDVHNATKKELMLKTSGVSFPREIYEKNLGNATFHVMETTITIDTTQKDYKLYAAIVKGYKFMVNLTYYSNEQFDKLDSIVNTIKFD